MTKTSGHRARYRRRMRAGALACAVVLTASGCSSETDTAATSGPRGTTSSTSAKTTSPSTAGSAAPQTPPARAGVTFGSALYGLSRRDLGRTLDEVVALRATWIRIDLSWAGIQPVSASSYDWAAVDAVVAAARTRKLEVLGLITYTPPWARAADCSRFSCPPADPADFTTFATATVRRYSPLGVRTYQIWNEPNITSFWRSPDPVGYGNLLRQAARAMRSAASGLTILFGGLAFTGDDDKTRAPGAIDAHTFLRRACAAGCPVDAVGYDPYTYPRLPSDPGGPLNAWQRIANPDAGATGLRSAMTAVGLSRAAVWVTAFGAPTTYRGATDAQLVSEQRQAQILTDGARLAGAAPNVIAAYFVNTLRDDPSAGPFAGHFGLVRSDGTRKPAFAALAAALQG